jgi:hypothetical protein
MSTTVLIVTKLINPSNLYRRLHSALHCTLKCGIFHCNSKKKKKQREESNNYIIYTYFAPEFTSCLGLMDVGWITFMAIQQKI